MKRVCIVGISLFAIAILTSGCKTKCVDPEVDLGVDRDTVLKLQKATVKDPTMCKELGHPTVKLLPPNAMMPVQNLVLTGTKDHIITKSDALPSNKLEKIKPLFDQLKSFRELWKQIRPGESFPGDITITLDAQLDFARALSVILSSVWAGYPNVHLSTGVTTFDTVWAVPRPPDPDNENKEYLTLVAESSDGKAFDLQLHSSKCTRKGSGSATDANLESAVKTLCGGAVKCADVVELRMPGTARFGDVAKLAHDMLKSVQTTPKPDLRLNPKNVEGRDGFALVPPPPTAIDPNDAMALAFAKKPCMNGVLPR